MDERSNNDLIKDYLTEYSLTHTEEDTIRVIQDMITKKRIKNLPDELTDIGKDLLSIETSDIILENIRDNEFNDPRIVNIIPLIVANNMVVKDSRKIKIDRKSLKRFLFLTATLLVSVITTSSYKNTNEKEETKCVSDSKNNINLDYVNTDTMSKIVADGYMSLVTLTTNLEKQVKKEYKKAIKLQKARVKKIESAEKKSVLYDFKKCKTLEDILKRQKELEQLGLTDKDKLYKDCKLSAPLQWFIYEQATISGFPADLLFSTIDTETMGEFNSSGLASYNPSYNGDTSKDSYDLGLTQQNTNSALLIFCEKYGIDPNDNDEYNMIYKLMRDNDYVNIASCLLLYKDIASRQESFDPIEYAGCYNGGGEWQTKKKSRAYVVRFENAYYGKYTKYHSINSLEKAKEKKKNSIKVLKKFKSNSLYQNSK